ncbi:predicted protein [Histoplasma capsulatum H143]|uniref:Uncharacterized protein n=1 Tax=Ajellomyces capsulatus (strain H143) TaxID=544712 RepID=C6HJF1_AJECH|nr:predicted protein [Histoplasma capsulatum H143]
MHGLRTPYFFPPMHDVFSQPDFSTYAISELSENNRNNHNKVGSEGMKAKLTGRSDLATDARGTNNSKLCQLRGFLAGDFMAIINAQPQEGQSHKKRKTMAVALFVNEARHQIREYGTMPCEMNNDCRTKARPSFALMTFVNWPFVVKQRLRGLWQTINRSLQAPTKQSAMAAREQCRWHTMTWSNVHVDSRRKPEKECLKPKAEGAERCKRLESFASRAFYQLSPRRVSQTDGEPGHTSLPQPAMAIIVNVACTCKRTHADQDPEFQRTLRK